MAGTHVELAEEFALPRWSSGYWGSRFFGTTGGALMDLLTESAESGLWSQYLYEFAGRSPDQQFDQPFDALVSLGQESGLPWYTGEDHYASLRPRLRNKWTFWAGSAYTRLVGETFAAFASTPRIRTPRTGVGIPIVYDSAITALIRMSHPIPANTLHPTNTRLKSISVYVGSIHSTQCRLAVYQGGTLADSNGATIIRDFGVTSGTDTDGWITLQANNEIIDPSEVLWVVWTTGATGFEMAWDEDPTDRGDFDPVDGRRVYVAPAVTTAYAPTLPSASSSSNKWYSVFLNAEAPEVDTYWSRFFMRWADGDHPITGPGVIVSSVVVGTTPVGPAGLTEHYYKSLRALTDRLKPADWVVWDYQFVLSNGVDVISLQGKKRFEDPHYTYHQV